MRILLDDCGYSWGKSWHIVTNTFAYTNHTVLAEALEKWDVNLVKQVIPRIFSIIVEITQSKAMCIWLFWIIDILVTFALSSRRSISSAQ